MKRKVQVSRTRMRDIRQLWEIWAGFGASPPPGTLMSSHVLISMIVIIVVICFVFPTRGQSDSAEWGILAARKKEYVSNDVPQEIPGRGTKTSTLTVTDSGLISDLDVKLTIMHPYDADLDVYLIAPDGTRVELFTDVGASQENFIDTILDNEAVESITDGREPFTGSYRPEGNLAKLYGKEAGGTWTLEVTDDWSSSRAGTLNAWSLIVTIEISEPLPAPVIQVESSVPGGMGDTLCWEDIGEIRQYNCNTPEAIPDQDTLMSELVIAEAGMIEDLNVGINISHSLDSDLDVFLIAPDGETRIELFTDVGGSGDDFEDTILDDEASASITKGSAPFAGSYRPEGHLTELVGQNICGTWTLEVTDDSRLSSGTLNSWSLMADLADVAYYSQCARDENFNNIVDDSGWITGTSHTFTGLTQTREYWYRAKARPMESWFQTSQEHFEKGTLSDTVITSKGDVVLAGGSGGLGPEVYVIDDPSFESLDIWKGLKTNDDIIVGFLLDDWATDGDRSGIVEFDYGSYYVYGDFGALIQEAVDFTGVDTLVFDYASWAFGQTIRAEVWLGETKIWQKNGEEAVGEPDGLIKHLNEEIDVSSYTGLYDLVLIARAMMSESFDSAIVWDNLRTYGPTGYVPSGQIVSIPINIGEADTWSILTFNATTPKGTELTLDVLPAGGSSAIPGYADLPSGTDLRGLDQKTIRLRANLSTSDSTLSPRLHDWSITYTDAVLESDWSNVESSS